MRAVDRSWWQKCNKQRKQSRWVWVQVSGKGDFVVFDSLLLRRQEFSNFCQVFFFNGPVKRNAHHTSSRSCLAMELPWSMRAQLPLFVGDLPKKSAVTVGIERLVWWYHSVKEPRCECEGRHGRQQPRVTKFSRLNIEPGAVYAVGTTICYKLWSLAHFLQWTSLKRLLLIKMELKIA